MAYRRDIRAPREVKPVEADLDFLDDYLKQLDDRHEHVRLPALRLVAQSIERHLWPVPTNASRVSFVCDHVLKCFRAVHRPSLEEVALLARLSAMLALFPTPQDDTESSAQQAAFVTAAGELVFANISGILDGQKAVKTSVEGNTRDEDGDEEDDEDEDAALEPAHVSVVLDSLTVLTALSSSGAAYLPGSSTPAADWIIAHVAWSKLQPQIAILFARYAALFVEVDTAPAQQLVALLQNDVLPKITDGPSMADFIGSVYFILVERLGSAEDSSPLFPPSALRMENLTGATKDAMKLHREVTAFYEVGEEVATPLLVEFKFTDPASRLTRTAAVELTTFFSKGVLAAIRAVFGNEGTRVELLTRAREYFIGTLTVDDFRVSGHGNWLDSEERTAPLRLKQRDYRRRAERDDKAARLGSD